ncbi:uncharacterized protein LOC127786185 [Oryza glaberrima]|nr:uncharacterized protein LOC127786185 [Oryza glaberrima]
MPSANTGAISLNLTCFHVSPYINHPYSLPGYSSTNQNQSREEARTTSCMAMAGESRRRRRAAAEAVAWCLALGVVALLLVGSVEEEAVVVVRGARLAAARPCEEIYMVEEGETLHSISDRCGDPYILEQNPHVHDPDDVFPGLVIKITPRPGRRN